MIATLNGKFLYSDLTSVIVECAGVGYKCFVTKNCLNNLPEKNSDLFLYTHLVVREDAMDLYGFTDIDELDAFKMITSVSGVGPKIGIAVLSELTPNRLITAIASNDPKTLTLASGVGIKLAQRIVLELKDKVGAIETSTEDIAVNVSNNSRANTSEAVEALMALGYTKGQSSLAVAKLDSSLSTNELIKLALQSLARGI